MDWIKGSRTSWWIGGALLLGAALAFRKALDFEVDFDPWADDFGY